MARERSPNRDKAFEIWQQSGGKISNREIAAKLDEDEKKIAVWKQRDKWNVVQQSNSNVVQQKKERCTTKPKKHGGQPGNKNAVGHGAPPKNQNATKHGLFAKYLPRETFEIAQGITEISPLDILWGNISIQYAAIIRAQKIMEVESKQEIIKELKTDGLNSTTYEFQYAWDRQASFMTAQSKAMTTLNNMIKQYDELCKSDLATEEQKARIAKMKADVEINKERLELERQKLKPPSPEDLPDDGFIDALKAETANIWATHGDDNG